MSSCVKKFFLLTGVIKKSVRDQMACGTVTTIETPGGHRSWLDVGFISLMSLPFRLLCCKILFHLKSDRDSPRCLIYSFISHCSDAECLVRPGYPCNDVVSSGPNSGTGPPDRTRLPSADVVLQNR